MESSSPILVAAFYRFMPLPRYRELREKVLAAGEAKSLRGSVLLAAEGINATVAGTDSDVRSFLVDLAGLLETSPLESKLSWCDELPFQRWKVRLKREIVALKVPGVDPLERVGDYVEPEDWNRIIEDPAVKVIDVRNAFEIEYGTFEGAANPRTEDFSEFPDYVRENLPDKAQPVAMFCTGGIRCEKATAYLLAQGYENVKHLRGGILKYLETVPPEESRWHGSCFVFDERVAVDSSLRPISKSLNTNSNSRDTD